MFVTILFIVLSIYMATYYRACKIRYRLASYDKTTDDSCFYGNDAMVKAYNKQYKTQ